MKPKRVGQKQFRRALMMHLVILMCFVLLQSKGYVSPEPPLIRLLWGSYLVILVARWAHDFWQVSKKFQKEEEEEREKLKNQLEDESEDFDEAPISTHYIIHSEKNDSS